jgi:hypothetical protein
LDFDTIGGVPFCFYRFASRPFLEHLREVCLAAEEGILKLPAADHWEKEQSDQEMQQFGTTSRFPVRCWSKVRIIISGRRTTS